MAVKSLFSDDDTEKKPETTPANTRALNFESAIALDFRCPLKRRRAEIISCAFSTILIYAGRHKNVCALGLRIEIDRSHRRGTTGENDCRKWK